MIHLYILCASCSGLMHLNRTLWLHLMWRIPIQFGYSTISAIIIRLSHGFIGFVRSDGVHALHTTRVVNSCEIAARAQKYRSRYRIYIA